MMSIILLFLLNNSYSNERCHTFSKKEICVEGIAVEFKKNCIEENLRTYNLDKREGPINYDGCLEFAGPELGFASFLYLPKSVKELKDKASILLKETREGLKKLDRRVLDLGDMAFSEVDLELGEIRQEVRKKCKEVFYLHMAIFFKKKKDQSKNPSQLFFRPFELEDYCRKKTYLKSGRLKAKSMKDLGKMDPNGILKGYIPYNPQLSKDPSFDMKQLDKDLSYSKDSPPKLSLRPRMIGNKVVVKDGEMLKLVDPKKITEGLEVVWLIVEIPQGRFPKGINKEEYNKCILLAKEKSLGKSFFDKGCLDSFKELPGPTQADIDIFDIVSKEGPEERHKETSAYPEEGMVASQSQARFLEEVRDYFEGTELTSPFFHPEESVNMRYPQSILGDLEGMELFDVEEGVVSRSLAKREGNSDSHLYSYLNQMNKLILKGKSPLLNIIHLFDLKNNPKKKSLFKKISSCLIKTKSMKDQYLNMIESFFKSEKLKDFLINKRGPNIKKEMKKFIDEFFDIPSSALPKSKSIRGRVLKMFK